MVISSSLSADVCKYREWSTQGDAKRKVSGSSKLRLSTDPLEDHESPPPLANSIWPASNKDVTNKSHNI